MLHFKYVDKKMVGGKWRYYYAQTANDLKRAKENFEWGFKIGSKKDPNTGRALNGKNVNPEIYRKLADKSAYLQEKYEPDFFYEGEEKEKYKKKQYDYYQKEIAKHLEAHVRGKSFMGNLGQIAGRNITNFKYQINKGKEWINKYF